MNPDTFAVGCRSCCWSASSSAGSARSLGVVAGALFIEYVPLYSPDILSWVENPFGSPLDPNRAGASAAVYGLDPAARPLTSLPAGAAGLAQNGLQIVYTSVLYSPWYDRARGTAPR